MGSVNAIQTKQIISAYTSVVNSAVTNLFNTSNLVCNANDELTLNVGGGDCKFLPQIQSSTFNIGQQVKGDCSLNSDNVNKLNAQFSNTVKTTTEQFIKDNVKNYNGWLAFGFSLNIANASNADELSQTIVNSFQTDIKNACNAEITAYAQATINFCSDIVNSTINFTQDAAVTSITSCITRNVIDIFASNTVLTKFVQETDAHFANTNAGLGSWIEYLLIGLVVIVIVIMIVYYLFNYGTSPPPTNAPYQYPQDQYYPYNSTYLNNQQVVN